MNAHNQPPTFDQLHLPSPNDIGHLTLISPFDTTLNEPAVAVPPSEITSDRMQSLADRMEAYCRGEVQGPDEQRRMIGVAAVQLGINVGVITVDTTAGDSTKPSNLVTIFGPRMTRHAGPRVLDRDACWSAAPFAGLTELYEDIELAGYDRQGDKLHLSLHGRAARAGQHEVNHTLGIRFPDLILPDHPERLHIVRPEDFPAYRQQWHSWEIFGNPEDWYTMKRGQVLKYI